MIEETIIYSLLTAAFTGGIAFGGVKVALNGTKKRLADLEYQESINASSHVQVSERLAKLETKIDMIYDKVK